MCDKIYSRFFEYLLYFLTRDYRDFPMKNSYDLILDDFIKNSLSCIRIGDFWKLW